MKTDELRKTTEYQKEIGRLRRESLILNDKSSTHPGQLNWLPGDLDNLKTHKAMIEGNAQGVYYKYNKEVSSYLTVQKQRLYDLHMRFKACQIEAENTGKSPDAVKAWPPDLLTKRIEIEARIDLYQEELDKINKLIDEFKEDEEKADEARILNRRHGLGVSKISFGVISLIDGQRVVKNAEGILSIADPRSPYDGCPVWLYSHSVVKAFALEKNIRYRIEEKQAKAEGRTFQKPKLPPLPKYDKKTKKFTYPGYNERTLKRLRK